MRPGSLHPRVITVATNPARRAGHLVPVRLLAESCRRNGFPLTVLGAGRSWKGYGTKLRLVREYLRGVRAGALVVFVDAYDSLFLPSHDRLVERFLAFDRPLVFSAEKGCWPDGARAARYPRSRTALSHRRSRPLGAAAPRPAPPSQTPFRYLNSGGYMGHAGALLEALDDLSPGEGDDDQRLFTDYFLKHPDRVGLDHEATIFQTLYEVEPADFDWSRNGSLRLRSRLTGSEPCVLHGNGPGWETFVTLIEGLRVLGWP